MHVMVEDLLWDSDEAFALGERLGDRDAWRYLVRLWAWALRTNRDDGIIKVGVPAWKLASECGFDGEPHQFVAALVETKWLQPRKGGGYRIRGWDLNTVYIRKRARDRDRMKKKREAERLAAEGLVQQEKVDSSTATQSRSRTADSDAVAATVPRPSRDSRGLSDPDPDPDLRKGRDAEHPPSQTVDAVQRVTSASLDKKPSSSRALLMTTPVGEPVEQEPSPTRVGHNGNTQDRGTESAGGLVGIGSVLQSLVGGGLPGGELPPPRDAEGYGPHDVDSVMRAVGFRGRWKQARGANGDPFPFGDEALQGPWHPDEVAQAIADARSESTSAGVSLFAWKLLTLRRQRDEVESVRAIFRAIEQHEAGAEAAAGAGNASR